MTKTHIKHIHQCLLAILACVVLATVGCASNKSEKPEEKNPEVGMTKEQVIAMYGETKNIQVSSEGETWIYNLNMGKAFIPFNYGYRPKMRMIYFDNEGKVARWSYSQ